MYKELERQLKEKNTKMSLKKAIEFAESIYEIQIKVPNSDEKMRKPLILTQEQRNLADLFDFGC